MSSIQITVKDQSQIKNAADWVYRNLQQGLKAGPAIVELKRPSRTLDQNRLLWAVLRDFEQQAHWPTHSNIKRSSEQWKILFMSAYRQETSSTVMGINGEVVNLNLSTSKLNKTQFSELMEFIYALGSGWGVKWSDPALSAYDELGVGNG